MVAGPRVIHTFPGNNTIQGLALLHNELYVLRHHNNKLDVHSTIDFTRRRHVSVDGATGAALEDIASCPHKRCIYVLNSTQSEYETDFGIHRLGLDQSACKWPLDIQPLNVSVTRSSNLLVVCTLEDGKLEKLLLISSDNGDCLRTFTPRLDENYIIYYCMELSDEHYVISYSREGDDEGSGTVSHMDGEGEILHSSIDEVRMNRPRYMSSDSDQFVFVAVEHEKRVLLFDPSLKVVRSVTRGLDIDPSNLVYEELTRRLYIGSRNADVTVLQL